MKKNYIRPKFNPPRKKDSVQSDIAASQTGIVMQDENDEQPVEKSSQVVSETNEKQLKKKRQKEETEEKKTSQKKEKKQKTLNKKEEKKDEESNDKKISQKIQNKKEEVNEEIDEDKNIHPYKQKVDKAVNWTTEITDPLALSKMINFTKSIHGNLSYNPKEKFTITYKNEKIAEIYSNMYPPKSCLLISTQCRRK